MASKMASLEDLTTCHVCFETLEQGDTKLLPCHHNFCATCVKKLTNNQRLKCPTCNRVADEKDVQTDFKFSQMMEAISDIQLRLQNANASEEKQKKCQKCTAKQPTHECDTCGLELCEDCKTEHGQAAETKTHTFTSLAVKAREQMRFQLKSRLLDIEAKVKEMTEGRAIYERHVKGFDQIQQHVLGECEALRHECFEHLMIKFESAKLEVVQQMQETRKRFLYDQTDIGEKLEKMLLVKSKIERTLKKGHRLIADGPKLDEEAWRLLDSMHMIAMRPSLPHMHVSQNKKWFAMKPWELDMHDHREDGCPIHHHVEETSKWVEKASKTLLAPCETLRAIKTEIYCVSPDIGIVVYDADTLKLSRKILNTNGMGTFHDVAALQNGNDVIVATSTGLYHFNKADNKQDLIAAGHHMCLSCHNDHVWVSCFTERDEVEVRMYMYEKRWKLMRAVELRDEFQKVDDTTYVTISARKDRLKCVSTTSPVIVVQELYGERLMSTWARFGSEARPKVQPRICHDDYHGDMLLLSKDARRLVVLHEAGCMDTVTLHSNVGKPHTVVFHSDYAYVLSENKQKLRKFHTH